MTLLPSELNLLGMVKRGAGTTIVVVVVVVRERERYGGRVARRGPFYVCCDSVASWRAAGERSERGMLWSFRRL